MARVKICGITRHEDAELVASLADDPNIFALANPDPAILPEDVAAIRDDAIMATGRSDYPNQVNNVLGFPFIFRGALDVRARSITPEMMLAATRGGSADALFAELKDSQPQMLAYMQRSLAIMPPKAYRWVAEMHEIADFVSEDPAGHEL